MLNLFKWVGQTLLRIQFTRRSMQFIVSGSSSSSKGNCAAGSCEQVKEGMPAGDYAALSESVNKPARRNKSSATSIMKLWIWKFQTSDRSALPLDLPSGGYEGSHLEGKR